MTEYQFGKLYKLQTKKRLYDKAFSSKNFGNLINNDPKVIEFLKENDIVIVLSVMRANNWDEVKVISHNGNLGWIDNINEEFYGFIEQINPPGKKNE